MGLDITGFGAIATAISSVIDKVIPDKTAAASAKAELEKLQQSGDLQLMLGQIEINKVEATSASIFVSGWRPAVGWICAFALAANYFIIPLLAWLSLIANIPTPPKLDLSELLTLLGGMLGFGILRSSDKYKGVAK